MKKVGVALSDCGVYDGSEIHEMVITPSAIARSGTKTVCFVPNKTQAEIINRLTNKTANKGRNIL